NMGGVNIGIVNTRVEWLEVDKNNTAGSCFGVGSVSTINNTEIIANTIAHNVDGGNISLRLYGGSGNRVITLINCIGYNYVVAQNTGGDGAAVFIDDADAIAYNLTIHRCVRNSSSAGQDNYGINIPQGTAIN